MRVRIWKRNKSYIPYLGIAPEFNFEQVRSEAYEDWNRELSRVKVEGGTYDQKVVFYSGLYHTLIHPNILNDVNGEYPAMESGKTLKTDGTRYTVFSLWDTYRNFHQLQTLLYPEKQIDMVNSMVDMYKESGWLPKWELYGRETLTMEGDPAIPVIVDSYMKGLTLRLLMKQCISLPRKWMITSCGKITKTIYRWAMCRYVLIMITLFLMLWSITLPTMHCLSLPKHWVRMMMQKDFINNL